MAASIKTKMSFFGSKSSNKILVWKRIGAGKKINTAEQQHTRENNHLVSIFVSKHFSQSSTGIKPIPRDNRSSLPEAFYKKGVLRHFAKFRGKHLFQRFFLVKLQARPEILY